LLCPGGGCAALYWEAYNTAKQNKEAFDRITTFHELEIFSSNITFACLTAIALVLFNFATERRSGNRKGRNHARKTLCTPGTTFKRLPKWARTPAWQIVAFLIVGLVMFSRYLYFTRAHTIEVLTSYAYMKP
jgi:hypothetical protein